MKIKYLSIDILIFWFNKFHPITLVLGQLPLRKIAPDPNVNPYPDPNRGGGEKFSSATIYYYFFSLMALVITEQPQQVSGSD